MIKNKEEDYNRELIDEAMKSITPEIITKFYLDCSDRYDFNMTPGYEVDENYMHNVRMNNKVAAVSVEYIDNTYEIMDKSRVRNRFLFRLRDEEGKHLCYSIAFFDSVLCIKETDWRTFYENPFLSYYYNGFSGDFLCFIQTGQSHYRSIGIFEFHFRWYDVSEEDAIRKLHSDTDERMECVALIDLISARDTSDPGEKCEYVEINGMKFKLSGKGYKKSYYYNFIPYDPQKSKISSR